MFLKSIFVAIVFFLLCPGIILSLPPKGSLMLVAAVHALIFALVICLSYDTIDSLDVQRDGFATPRAWCISKPGYTWNVSTSTCYNATTGSTINAPPAGN